MGRKDKDAAVVEEVFSEETYPDVTTPEAVASHYLVLDQYRQSIASQAPLPIEWLANSLYEARACDVFEFVASLRQQRDEQTAAQEAAAAEADAAA